MSATLPGTSTTHEVRLSGNRFTPSEIRVAPDDTIRFINGMGGPHNVQFMAESISVPAQAILNDAMKDRILPLTSPMFLAEGEQYELVVPKLPAGRYPFLCSPHWANMRGALVVTN
jgi:plastocyanin